MKLNTVNQSSVTMETRVEMHHMRYKKKDEGQFHDMLSLDLENGLYPSCEELTKGPILIFSPFSTFDLEISDLDLGQGHSN